MNQLVQCFDIGRPRQVEIFGRGESPPKPKPFLKWAGGKSHLVPLLLKCAPRTYGRYFEPFLGRGALFFGLSPQNAVLCDSNCDLIHCYQIVRDRPKDLIELATLAGIVAAGLPRHSAFAGAVLRRRVAR